MKKLYPNRVKRFSNFREDIKLGDIPQEQVNKIPLHPPLKKGEAKVLPFVKGS
jgi:hypothetical protein